MNKIILFWTVLVTVVSWYMAYNSGYEAGLKQDTLQYIYGYNDAIEAHFVPAIGVNHKEPLYGLKGKDYGFID